MSEANQKLYSVAEAAQILNIHKSTVWKFSNNGDFSTTKEPDSNMFFFTEEQMEFNKAYIEEKRAESFKNEKGEWISFIQITNIYPELKRVDKWQLSYLNDYLKKVTETCNRAHLIGGKKCFFLSTEALHKEIKKRLPNLKMTDDENTFSVGRVVTGWNCDPLLKALGLPCGDFNHV